MTPASLGSAKARDSHAARVARYLCLGIIVGCSEPQRSALPPLSDYVSDSACATCHESQHSGWQGSHHDLAMQLATPSSVLGDFNDSSFEDSGIRTRFFMRGDAHMVETEGPDGGLAEFKVAYTFGVEPLQQYLIEFPGGRLQALTVAWDTESERWYDLYPDQRIAADDPLHWTGRLQNWNTMCAECHSTALVKGYDEETDTFNTTWEALNVGCQACHGPGREHMEWANGPTTEGDMGLDRSLRRGHLGEQLNTCAPCHSRRATLSHKSTAGGDLFDLYAPAHIQPGLYHADGQILDEVYVYGSFMQSLMSQKGVTCTDCHDAHSLELHAPDNAVCTQCHTTSQPLERFADLKAKNYDDPSHHFHPPGTPGASCVNCHMPTSTYMGIDDRRDHSIRIPRPDLSVELGTPNACNQCHKEESAEWAAAAIDRWYGAERADSFTELFAKATAEGPQHAQRLRSFIDTGAPPILRASALERLSRMRPPAPETLPFTDEDPMVRAAAIRALTNAPPKLQIQLAQPALLDEVRGVRLEAARLLAGAPPHSMEPASKLALENALDEYIHSQEIAADTPAAHLNLALLEQDLGALDKAAAHYKRAIKLDPFFLPAQFNLATLLNGQGQNDLAAKVLKRAIERQPEEGELYFSLSLLLAEQGDMHAASEALQAAASLLPDRPRVHYNLGLTKQHLGARKEAEAALLKALVLDRDEPDFIYALAIFYMQGEEWNLALRYAEQLAALTPEDPGPAALIERASSELESLRNAGK